jgi:hypothetical protein
VRTGDNGVQFHHDLSKARMMVIFAKQPEAERTGGMTVSFVSAGI